MRFQKLLLTLIATVFLLVPAFAQNLSISGTVQDADGVVPDTNIRLRGSSGDLRQAITDSSGHYTFTGLNAGRYELTFERKGFATLTQAAQLSSNDVRPVDVTLRVAGTSTTVDVSDVAGKATASRMDIPNIDLPVQVSTISQQVLEQQGVNDLVTALRNASGVSAERFYGAYEYYTIRGFMSSDAPYDLLLVDGMRLEGNRFNTQLNNVESVEVLKGPSSVLYSGGGLGGVINITRKKPHIDAPMTSSTKAAASIRTRSEREQPVESSIFGPSSTAPT
jgi:iron complex outermembrane receptor protein